MQATITVREFCEKYLTSSQKVALVDAENDYIYYKGEVRNILSDESNTTYNVRIFRVDSHDTRTEPFTLNNHIILVI